MTTRWHNWRAQRRKRRAQRDLQQQRPGELREFVYLDEVSVTSLLSSRLGKVPSEFTDSRTNSLKAELNASISANAGIAKSGVGSRVEAGRTEDTKVVSKATIQTTFKNLFDGERDSLVLKVPKKDERAEYAELGETEALATSDGPSRWKIPVDLLKRGELIEVQVELQADPTFQISTIIAVMADLLADSKTLRSYTNQRDIESAVEVNTLLGKLMVGLVPLKCRLSDYVVTTAGEQERLLHQDVLKTLPTGEKPPSRDVYLVGVAEEALFWRDLRRVLFTQSRFRVLCRLNHDGLTNTWQSVKLVDVLGDVAPELKEQMRIVGSNTLDNITALAAMRRERADPRRQALITYGESFADALGIVLDDGDRHAMEETASAAADLLTSVPASRPAFDQITGLLADRTRDPIDHTLAARLRAQACQQHNLHPGGSQHGTTTTQPAPRTPEDHRFIDAEIIAIYW